MLGWAFIGLMMVGLFGFPLTMGMPLGDPDEGVHAMIAQEMVERGDWITPRLLGQPFRDKPILYFWLQAMSLAMFGMNEVAVRLPGMLVAACGVVTTGILAGRLFDRRAGLIAASLYATMILPTALAQMPVHDILLVPCVTLAILGLWNAERAAGWRRLWYAVAAGIALGLAGLAKGLPGVAVVGVAYAIYFTIDNGLAIVRFARGSASEADRKALANAVPTMLAGLAALLVGAVVAVPWYVACEIRDPGYLRYFFVDRHVKGFVSSTQSHGGRPFWYYIPFIVLGGLPAAGYVPSLLLECWRTRQIDRPTLLTVSWLLGGLAFFSAASSKLVTYIWPLLPAIAILAAVPWARLLSGSLGDASRRLLSAAFHISCWSGCIVLPATAWAVREIGGIGISGWGWLAIGLATCMSLLPLWCWRTGRIGACVAAGGAAVTLQFMVFMKTVFVPLAAGFSARDLAHHFNSVGNVPRQVITLNHPAYSQVFYLEPSLRTGLDRSRFSVCLSRDYGRWPAFDPEAVVAVDEVQLKKISKTVRLDGLSFERVGSWRLYPAAVFGERGASHDSR